MKGKVQAPTMRVLMGIMKKCSCLAKQVRRVEGPGACLKNNVVAEFRPRFNARRAKSCPVPRSITLCVRARPLQPRLHCFSLRLLPHRASFRAPQPHNRLRSTGWPLFALLSTDSCTRKHRGTAFLLVPAPRVAFSPLRATCQVYRLIRLSSSHCASDLRGHLPYLLTENPTEIPSCHQ